MSGRDSIRLAVSNAEPVDGGGGGATTPPADDEPVGCPVWPLGTRRGVYFFFDSKGQFREIADGQLGQQPKLLALFGGDKSWPAKHFPQLDKEGAPTGWFSARALCAWLMRRCTAEKLFSGEESVRDIGVWRTPKGVALHLGDDVILEGRSRRAGFRDWGCLWPAVPPVAPPAKRPATAEQAASVEALFGRWAWLNPQEVSLFYGGWAAGLLGAAIRWRPHLLIVGDAGWGKTSLMEAYCAASPLAKMHNDYTEPGLRQAFNGRAGPVILDEAEGDKDGAQKLQGVIEWLRRASSGAGVKALRGSAGGQAQHFELVATGVLGGILPPALGPQDSDRITRIDLRPPPLGGRPLPNEAEIEALRKLAPYLWSRALAGMGRFEANFARLRSAFMGRGCTPRLADQIGTILAMREMMLFDDPMPDGREEELWEEFRPWLPASVEQADERGPASCLLHLLQSASEVYRQGERPTLGQLIWRARNGDVDGQAADEALQAHGLRRCHPPRPPDGPSPAGHRWLVVADSHPQLEKLFAGTRWTGKRWKEDLRRLAGAVPHNLNIQRRKVRCTLIPAEHLPGMEDDHAE